MSSVIRFYVNMWSENTTFNFMKCTSSNTMVLASSSRLFTLDTEREANLESVRLYVFIIHTIILNHADRKNDCICSIISAKLLPLVSFYDE